MIIMTLIVMLASALITTTVLEMWLRLGACLPIDVANSRSLHAGSVPRIGGMAMGLGIGFALQLTPSHTVPAVPVLAATGLLLLSFVDDWCSLPIFPRLLGHLLAAGVVVAALHLPLWPSILAVFAIVWATNLYNFMDGADGLAGGMTAIGFGAYALAAWPVSPEIFWISIPIAGAAMGFLIFNFPPAKVFMGDAGSIPVGFLAGALGLIGWRNEIWPFWFPALVFSPFLVDATATVLRRLLSKQKVWQAHREHYYQRLVLMNWSHRRLALLAWGLMITAAGSALWLKSLDESLHWPILMAWVVVYGYLLRTIGRI